MSDETLVAEQLEEKADEGLITDFDPDSLSGASYDFRAGKTVVVARPDENVHRYESLKDAGKISLNPGAAYTFYSLEKVNLPSNIKGRLSMRSYLANKKLFFPGGLIDPGYKGYLFFTVFNLGNSTIEIEFGDEIVSGEFTRIKETNAYTEDEEDEVTQLGEDKLPPLPSQPQKMYDWSEMNALLTEHDEKLQDVEDTVGEVKNEIKNTNQLIENLFLAAIAATIAGVAAGVTIEVVSLLLS